MKWINKNWARIGGIAGVGIILVVLFTDLLQTDIEGLLWLHLAVLLLHQFEEYVYPGGFKDFFNDHIWNKNPITRYPLNDFGILWVNVIVAWTAYLYAAMYSTEALWLTAGLLFITFFNGLLHTTIAVIKKKYNPGFYTGLFLFIPFSLYVIFKLSVILTATDWQIGIMIFLIGTALIPVSIGLSNKVNGKGRI